MAGIPNFYIQFVSAIVLIIAGTKRIYNLPESAAGIVKIPIAKKILAGNVKVFIFMILKMAE